MFHFYIIIIYIYIYLYPNAALAVNIITNAASCFNFSLNATLSNTVIACPSNDVTFNDSINVTTITDTTKIPKTQTINITNLPKSVLVKKSP